MLQPNQLTWSTKTQTQQQTNTQTPKELLNYTNMIPALV